MFGFSFGELLVISLVTLVAVGPQKLPGMLKTMGQWARKLRKMTMDVRQQTGIDEMLRAEGIQISELRSLMRGYHGGFPGQAAAPAPTPAPAPSPAAPPSPRYDDPYGGFEPDPTREYPPEGADAYGALPDDLLEPPTSNEVAAAPGAPEPKPEPVVEALTPPEPANAVAEAMAASAAAAPADPAPPPAAPASEPAAPAAPTSAPSAAASAPPPAPVRSAPPPPPSRTGAPRPSGSPPPPPRRTAPPPPRPDSSAPVKTDAPAVTPPSPGTPNGNG